MEISLKRERGRKRKYERYHTEPEFRSRQLKYSSEYQKRMWATSDDFRQLKAYQKQNPKFPPVKGRPRLD